MQLELGWVKKESRLLSAGLSDRAERVVNWNIHSFWVQRQAESFRSCVWVRAVDVNYGWNCQQERTTGSRLCVLGYFFFRAAKDGNLVVGTFGIQSTEPNGVSRRLCRLISKFIERDETNEVFILLPFRGTGFKLGDFVSIALHRQRHREAALRRDGCVLYILHFSVERHFVRAAFVVLELLQHVGKLKTYGVRLSNHFWHVASPVAWCTDAKCSMEVGSSLAGVQSTII
jgi:hypothetical protein